MYASTRGPKVKRGDTDFKWGTGHQWTSAGDGPGPAVTKLVIEHRATGPHILSVSLRWKNLVTCQQQFVQLHHVVLRLCGYKDLCVCACVLSA